MAYEIIKINDNTWRIEDNQHVRFFLLAGTNEALLIDSGMDVHNAKLQKAKKIVIIDHHRRSADYIENATLTFQEVYASSAAELVTELLQYSEIKRGFYSDS